MARKIVLSEEEKNTLIVLYQSGLSLRQLEKRLHHDRNTLSKMLKEEGINIRTNSINSRRYHHDENFFEKIDTEEKAYWLGFIYADGFIESKRLGCGEQKIGITLKETDVKHLYKFKEHIGASNPIYCYAGSGYNKEGRCAKILLTSQKTVNDLKNKGVVEQKTLKLVFPNEDIVPKNLLRHFIRGYFDGDGSISYYSRKGINKVSRNYLVGFTGTYDMLYGILRFFNKTQIKICSSKNVFQINIGGNKQLRCILKMLYDEAHIYLDRKYKIYNKYLKYVEKQG